jgi:hypothetical protein
MTRELCRRLATSFALVRFATAIASGAPADGPLVRILTPAGGARVNGASLRVQAIAAAWTPCRRQFVLDGYLDTDPDRPGWEEIVHAPERLIATHTLTVAAARAGTLELAVRPEWLPGLVLDLNDPPREANGSSAGIEVIASTDNATGETRVSVRQPIPLTTTDTSHDNVWTTEEDVPIRLPVDAGTTVFLRVNMFLAGFNSGGAYAAQSVTGRALTITLTPEP